jgi:hypothetical protein
VVEVRLSDSDEGVFVGRNVPFSHSVMTTDVPGVNSRVIGGLDATGAT